MILLKEKKIVPINKPMNIIQLGLFSIVNRDHFISSIVICIELETVQF